MVDKLCIHPVLDTDKEMMVHNLLPEEEGEHRNRSHREENNGVVVEEEVVASCLASHNDKIVGVDVEKSLVMLNYHRPTAGIVLDSLQHAYPPV